MRALLLLTALAWFGAAAGSQTLTLQDVPAEARRLLLVDDYGKASAAPADGEIRLTAPSEFPAALLPAGAAVVASMRSSSATSVVARFEGEVLQLPQYNWQAEAAGWTNVYGRPAGFRSPDTFGPVLSFCKGSEFALVAAGRTADERQLVRVRLTRDTNRSCAAVGSDFFSDVPIPVLVPPAGVRHAGGSGSTGGNDFSSSVRLVNVPSIDALATDYTRQMRAHGWVLEGKTVSDGVLSVTRFSGSSRHGDSITAFLILTALPPTNAYDALLRFVRNKSERLP